MVLGLILLVLYPYFFYNLLEYLSNLFDPLFRNVTNLLNYQITCWVYIGFLLASARSILNDFKSTAFVFQKRKRVIDLLPTYGINYPFSILISSLIIDHVLPEFFKIEKIETQITLAVMFGFFIDQFFAGLPKVFKNLNFNKN